MIYLPIILPLLFLEQQENYLSCILVIYFPIIFLLFFFEPSRDLACVLMSDLPNIVTRTSITNRLHFMPTFCVSKVHSPVSTRSSTSTLASYAAPMSYFLLLNTQQGEKKLSWNSFALTRTALHMIFFPSLHIQFAG